MGDRLSWVARTYNVRPSVLYDGWAKLGKPLAKTRSKRNDRARCNHRLREIQAATGLVGPEVLTVLMSLADGMTPADIYAKWLSLPSLAKNYPQRYQSKLNPRSDWLPAPALVTSKRLYLGPGVERWNWNVKGKRRSWRR